MNHPLTNTEMSFTLTTLLNGRNFLFSFSRIETANGIKFFVFAEEPDGDSSSFNMEKKGECWRIVDAPKVDDIFVQHQEMLSDIIRKKTSA